jgi:hypothetical protein
MVKENQIRSACSIASGAESDLFEAHSGHTGHIVEHGSKVLIIRINIGLHGKKSSQAPVNLNVA